MLRVTSLVKNPDKGNMLLAIVLGSTKLGAVIVEGYFSFKEDPRFDSVIGRFPVYHLRRLFPPIQFRSR